MTATAHEDLAIAAGDVVLRGDLHVPHEATGMVVFAHGSGSSRRSPRNRWVASYFQERGFGTLLFDLLTTDEERADVGSGRYRFDIPFLAQRLVAVTDWLTEHGGTPPALGYFGASTGAAAALVAAAEMPDAVSAVVSRGGRPDLAGRVLGRVRAPTLLIVGGNDATVLALNERALAELRCEKELIVVPGATHLFEEPGTLDAVARHAAQWYVRHLPGPNRIDRP